MSTMHLERCYCHEVPSPRNEVFPLLCPVREVDWVPGWSCEMVHSDSGVAELGCVFRRTDAGLGAGIWVVSRYEPPAAIAFVITYPETHVERLSISLADTVGGTLLLWTRAYTSWTQAGHAMLEALAAREFEQRMALVAGALEHYCRTGRMIETGEPYGGRRQG